MGLACRSASAACCSDSVHLADGFILQCSLNVAWTLGSACCSYPTWFLFARMAAVVYAVESAAVNVSTRFFRRISDREQLLLGRAGIMLFAGQRGAAVG